MTRRKTRPTPRVGLCVLGAGRSQLPFLRSAKAARIPTVAFDRDPKAPGRAYADRFYPVGLDCSEEIARHCATVLPEIPLAACLAYTEFPAAQRTAAQLRERFDWRGTNAASLAGIHNKFDFSRRLRGAGLPAAQGEIIRTACELDRFLAQYADAVLKPCSGGAGSRGVARTHRDDPDRVTRLARALDADGNALIEPHLPGPELSLDGLVSAGAGTLLSIATKRPESGAGNPGYGLCAGYTIERREDPALEALAFEAAGALGIENSFFSFDVRMTAAGPVLIDGGPLLDAKIERLLVFDGVDVYGLGLAASLGLPIEKPALTAREAAVALRFLYAENEGELVLGAPSDLPRGDLQLEWERKHGDPVRPPASVADIVGIAMARGDDAESAWARANAVGGAACFQVRSSL